MLFITVAILLIVLWCLISKYFEKIGDIFIKLLQKIFGGM